MQTNATRQRRLRKEATEKDSRHIQNTERRLKWCNYLSIDEDEAMAISMQNVPILDEDSRRQVELDVARSLHHLRPAVKNLFKSRQQLRSVILYVLGRNPDLRYYQVRADLRFIECLVDLKGFHDVCSVLQLTLGSHRAALAADRIANRYFKDFMGSSFEILHSLTEAVLGLISITRPKLTKQLLQLQVPPFFTVSWLLTWCAHDINDLAVICRIYDTLLGMPPIGVIYFAAAMLLQHMDEIMVWTEGPSELHHWLKTLPSQTNVDETLAICRRLFDKVDHCALIRSMPALKRSNIGMLSLNEPKRARDQLSAISNRTVALAILLTIVTTVIYIYLFKPYDFL